MSKALFYFSSVLIILIFFACGKKQKSKLINADLKKHFSFIKGTYWVYFDILSGKTDSLIITHDYYQVEETNLGNVDYETHNIIQYENGKPVGSSHWALQTASVEIYFEFRPPNLHSGFVYPFPPDGTTTYGDTTAVKNISSMSINNNVFNEVCLFNYNGSNYDSYLYDSVYLNYRNDSIYVCPDVGIIKMCLNNAVLSNRLELLRYHIVH